MTTDTDKPLSDYERWKQDPISQKALERIETLQAALAGAQAIMEAGLNHLLSETKRLRDGAQDAQAVIERKKKPAPVESAETPPFGSSD